MNDILETLGRIEGMLKQLLDKEKPAKGKAQGGRPSEASRSAIALLNNLTGSAFKNPYRPDLEARISEYGLTSVEAVISNQYREWHNDPAMKKYLRPETLFNRTKFESYYNAIPQQPKQAEIPPEPPRNNWEDELEWRKWHELYGSCTRH